MAHKPTSGPKTIFVVEDDPAIRNFLVTVLEEMEYKVKSFASGEDSFSVIHRLKPHLVLVDILLADLDGLSLCKILKNNPDTRHIPVIMISCLSDASIMKNAESSGAVGFIAKPFKQAELKAKIDMALAAVA